MFARAASFAREMARIFVDRRVTRSAAALAYYLFLSIFPFLVCCSVIIGSLNISQQSLLNALSGIIPDGAINVIGEFLLYVRGARTAPALAAGFIAMVTTSSAAFRTVMGIMGDIQGAARFKGAKARLLSMALSVGFLAAIYISGLIVIAGGWLTRLMLERFRVGDTAEIWNWGRFAVLFLIMLAVVYAAYAISAPKGPGTAGFFPGAVIASAALVGVGMVFSRIINESAKYAVVYGYIASFAVMLVWLYTCGIIVISGNIFNAVRNK
jgi:membrane protein